MKKLQRFLAVGVVAVLLAACGGETEAPTLPVDGPEIGPWYAEPSPYDFEETWMDLDGRIITMLTVGGRNFWDYDRTDAELTTNETLAVMNVLRQIEREYNTVIELRYHTASGLMEMLVGNRTAGDTPFDLFEARMADFILNNLWTNGLVMPVSHSAIVDIIKPHDNPWRASEFLTFGEHQWAVSFNTQNSPYIMDNVLIFNNTLRENLGLPNFYDLVRNNQWTWDVFETVLHDVWERSNNTVFPIVYAHESIPMTMFVGANNGRIAENRPEGLVFVGHHDDNALYALNFLQQIGQRGWFHRFSPTQNHATHGHIGTALATGQAFFGMTGYGMIRNLTNQRENYQGEYTFGILPVPIGPNATEFISVAHNEILYHVMADIRHPQEAAAILVAMANRAGRRTSLVVAHELDYALQSDCSAEMLAIMLNNVIVDPSRIHGDVRRAGGDTIVNASLNILTNREAPVAAMQRISGQMQYWFNALNVIEIAN